MFERYTERARRVIFFARYEASQFGSHTIETEHLLLGLVREDKNLTHRFIAQSSTAEEIREAVKQRSTIHEKVSTSIDLPLTDECKRVLAYAAEEAVALYHRHIGTEQLLLGVLREGNSLAAQILSERGIRLNTIREELRKNTVKIADSLPGIRGQMDLYSQGPLPEAGVVPDETTARRIAEAVWTKAYCNEPDDRAEANTAELKFDVWIVTGRHLQNSAVLVAFIQKADGRILRIHLEPSNP